MAIGSLGGALLAARRPRPRLRFVVLAGAGFSIVEIVAGLMPTYTSFAAVLPVLGLCALTMVTSANATIQLTSSPMMRGRVAALYLMVFMGGTPIGAPIVGWVGETFGARWMMIGGGTLTLFGILFATLWYLRHHDQRLQELRAELRDLRWRHARRTDFHGVEIP
ncbi:MFS transporter [Aeromicrobium sp. UC242_57]|uniref:MFS transporter n=1 Tax=Aeromicrobium sp. UC242_57 TaxID=3374624 RepID=UPI003795B53B